MSASGETKTDNLIDLNLTPTNPGPYEELHKKTKGEFIFFLPKHQNLNHKKIIII